MGDLTAPRAKTVKRLFALSRNACAFPGCSTRIVDDVGTVVGEICHIRAQNPEGPRYDPSQDSEQRHRFENLVLMCGVHHKRVDENWKDFPVARLEQLKHEHEVASAHATAVDDSVIERLLDKLDNSGNVHAVTGNDSIVAGGNITLINNGLSLEEARTMALDVFRTNALELAGVARAVAQERAEAVTSAFLQKLYADSASRDRQQSLSDPDMQYALYAAQQAAARSGDPNLMSVLTDLLVDRAREQQDLMRVVLNEAIGVASRLTSDQFDTLSLLFVVGDSRNCGVRDRESFARYVEKVVAPLLSTASQTLARHQHLQYAGCASIGSLPKNSLLELTAASYPHLAEIDFSRAELCQVLSTDDAGIDSFLGHVLGPGEDDNLALLPRFDVEYTPSLEKAGVPSEVIRRFAERIRQKAQTAIRPLLLNLHPRMKELDDYWSKFGSFISLTSVGIAVAHANLRRRGLDNYDLAIWIS